MTYKLNVPSRYIPTELKVIQVTTTSNNDILRQLGLIAIEAFIQTRVGNAAITINQEPSFTINAVGNISVDNCVIEIINMTGSTAGEIILFTVSVTDALAKGWIK